MKKLRINKNKQKGFIINPFMTLSLPYTDPMWNMSQLQLNGDEASIVDRSPNNCTVTPDAGVIVSNTRSKHGSTSIYIPNTKKITFSKAGSFSYYGDFEIYVDVYFENTVSVNSNFFKIRSSETSGRTVFYLNNLNQLCYDIYGVGGSVGPTIPTGQWVSLIIARIDQWIYIGVNGTLYQLPKTSGTYGTIGNTSNGDVQIFGDAGGTGGLYFNNLRVLGCRNYILDNTTINYTPPTTFYAKQGVDSSVYDPMWKFVKARLPLNLDTGIADVSANKKATSFNRPSSLVSHASALGGYALYDTTNTDGFVSIYLNLIEYSNWTFEARLMWGNISTSDQRVLSFRDKNWAEKEVVNTARGSSGSIYSYNPVDGGWRHFGFYPVAGTYYNICIQRIGTLLMLIVDGVYRGQCYLTTGALGNLDILLIGGGPNNSSFFIDDIRFTIGTRYCNSEYFNPNGDLAHTQQFPVQGYTPYTVLPDVPEYAADVLLDNPLFYYRLNESSGTVVVDSSGNARNGTYVNSPMLQQIGLLTNESSNKAILLSGTEYINIPSATWMNVGNTISLEAIININSGISQTIINRRVNTGDHVFQIKTIDNTLLINIFDSSSTAYTWYNFNYPIKYDTIYHIVVTYNGSQVKFYVNGRLVDQSYSVVSLPVAPVAPIEIGRCGAAVSPYDPYYGVIDEVAMYGTTLPYNRITSHADKAKLLLTDNTLTKALTGASCILALRVLKPGYTGYIIKVRRSSDNTELNIGSVNGELDTTTLLNFVGSGNGYVSYWYDQSGTGNHFWQTGIYQQPIIVSNGIIENYAGKPIIRFANDTSQYLSGNQILDNNYHFTINYLSDIAILGRGSGSAWNMYMNVYNNRSSIVLTSGGTAAYDVQGSNTSIPEFKTKRLQYIHGTTSYLKSYNNGEIDGEAVQNKYSLRPDAITGVDINRAFGSSYTIGRVAGLIIHNSLLPDYLSDVIRLNQSNYYDTSNSDSLFMKTRLLLHFDNIVNNTTIIDNSFYRHGVTVVGNPVLTNSITLIDKECVYFAGGNNNYLSIPSTIYLDLTNQAFALEASIYATSFVTVLGLFCRVSATTGLSYEHAIFLNESYISIYYGIRGTNQAEIRLFFPSVLQTNTKYNILLQRSSNGTWSVYVNGTVGTQYQVAPLAATKVFGSVTSGSYVNAVNFGSNNIPITIGGDSLNLFASANYYVDELRLTIDDIRQTGNYTPSTIPYLNY